MDLHSTLRVLRRHYRLMFVCVILATGAAYAVATIQKKEYRAQAVLLFHDPGYAGILFGSNVSSTAPDPTRNAATDLDLVSLQVVAARTAAAIRGMTSARVRGDVTVAADGESDTVSIFATDHDPRLAAQLATTYGRQFIAFRRSAARADLRTAEQVVQRQLLALPTSQQSGSVAAGLKNRADELQVLAALQTGNAQLVQPATVPRSQSSPAPRRTAAIGLALGLVLAVLLVQLRERLDRRIRDADEIEEVFGRPILGTIPHVKAFRAKSRDSGDLPAREREAFIILSTSLRYFNGNRNGGVKTILVTSAASGEGKTTIARNLAAGNAVTRNRTLLIEADLRHPVLVSRLGLSEGPGLSDVLAGQLNWRDALREVAVNRGGTDILDDLRFDLLPAGGVPPNPTDLIGSEAMKRLLEEVEPHYRLVIIDTPPTAIVSDAIPLLSLVDGVIVVARLNMSMRDSIRHLERQLKRLGAPVLGVVINDVARSAGYYGYSADYHYATSDPNGSRRTREPAKVVATAESPEVDE